MEPGFDGDYNEILNTLTSDVNGDTKQTEARKRLRIEKWLRVNIQLVQYFSGIELKFFSDIFSNNSCWEGTRLKNEVVGLKLIKERSDNGRENPLDLSDRYYLACKYCLEDKIPGLLEELFIKYKNKTFEEDMSDDELRDELLDHLKESSPIEAFWSSLIDKQTGSLKRYEPVDGFKKAVQVNSRKNWGEGIEFFFDKLQEDKSNLLINFALSGVRGYKNADVIEFCLSKMNNDQKKKLLKRDLKENTYYAVLSELIDAYCFDSFKNLFDLLEYNDLSVEEYGIMLSSISRRILLNSDLAEETRETIMYAWKHKNFDELRKSVFKDFSIEYAIADLIEDSRNGEGKNSKVEKILEILKYSEVTQRRELKKSLIKAMSVFHRVGKKQFNEDKKLIKQLFSKLNML